MKHRQSISGFTLIELMIVLAILGILGSIALPAYQASLRKAHVTEGLQLASTAKVAVATYHAINGKHAAGENLHNQLGLPPADEFKGKAVDSVSVGEEGVIRVAYNEKVHGGGDNAARAILALRPVLASGSFSWQCELPAETGILAEYAPAGCAAPGS